MAEEKLAYTGTVPADRFTFEENFDADYWVNWVKEHQIWSVLASAVYILLVFSGRRWMEHRPAYRLKTPLILWNVLLGVFSVLGAWRCVPVLTKALLANGWHSTVCNTAYFNKEFIGIWGVLFTLSKIPELGDTAFVVLRKQRMIFLHWYHHASVPLFVFAAYGNRASPGVWYATMNFFVHGLMYPYFGLRAAGFRLPKIVAVTITSLQIIQMLIGNILVIHAAVAQYYGIPCHIDQGVLMISIALYFSYMVLFAEFFYATYFGKKRTGAKTEDTNPNLVKGEPNGVKDNSATSEGMRKRELHSN